MGLNHSCDDIGTVLQSGPCLLQHLKGLAHAGSRTEKNLQPAAAPFFSACPLKEGVRRRALVRIAPLICHGASVLARDLVPLAHHGVPARSRARFSASTFTPGSPKTPRVRPSICSATSWRTRILRHVTRLRNARDLEIGGLRRDVRVEPAARRGYQIDRNLGARVLLLELLHVARHPLDQRLVGRAEIGAHGVDGVIGDRGRL